MPESQGDLSRFVIRSYGFKIDQRRRINDVINHVRNEMTTFFSVVKQAKLIKQHSAEITRLAEDGNREYYSDKGASIFSQFITVLRTYEDIHSSCPALFAHVFDAYLRGGELFHVDIENGFFELKRIIPDDDFVSSLHGIILTLPMEARRETGWLPSFQSAFNFNVENRVSNEIQILTEKIRAIVAEFETTKNRFIQRLKQGLMEICHRKLVLEPLLFRLNINFQQMSQKPLLSIVDFQQVESDLQALKQSSKEDVISDFATNAMGWVKEHEQNFLNYSSFKDTLPYSRTTSASVSSASSLTCSDDSSESVFSTQRADSLWSKLSIIYPYITTSIIGGGAFGFIAAATVFLTGGLAAVPAALLVSSSIASISVLHWAGIGAIAGLVARGVRDALRSSSISSASERQNARYAQVSS